MDTTTTVNKKRLLKKPVPDSSPSASILPLPVAMDSGAFGWYMKNAAPRTEEGIRIRGEGFLKLINHEYLKLPEFSRYLEDYMTFIRHHGNKMIFCTSLDVLFNAEKSWEIYKELTAEGFKVLPVYHYGEDIKWLKKYLDSTDYIGLGGLVKTGNAQSSVAFQERTWREICDSKGRPRVKVHGFGMSSTAPMQRRPYYSVDSTTPVTWSRYGSVMMPRKTVHNGWDYSRAPLIYPLSPGRATAVKHVDHGHPSGATKAAIEEYLTDLGLTVEDVKSTFQARDVANFYFMHKALEMLAERHSENLGMKIKMRFYVSGNFTDGKVASFGTTIKHLESINATNNLGYLGTFDGPRPVERLFKMWTGKRIKFIKRK